jgi:hypothetical protein
LLDELDFHALFQLISHQLRLLRLVMRLTDADGNEVAYDLQAVTAQAEADAQSVIDTKASALAKLAALGLTQDEVKALVG